MADLPPILPCIGKGMGTANTMPPGQHAVPVLSYFKLFSCYSAELLSWDSVPLDGCEEVKIH